MHIMLPYQNDQNILDFLHFQFFASENHECNKAQFCRVFTNYLQLDGDIQSAARMT